ncbi:MAG: hypothetical protein AAFQ81_11280 [Pseudomonadota bacterium]
MELKSTSPASAREPGAADPELTAIFDGAAPIAGDLSWAGSMHPAVYITIALLVILVPLFLFLVVYRKPAGPRETDGLDREIATHWSERGYGDGLYGDSAVRRANIGTASSETGELSASHADEGYRRRLARLTRGWEREGRPGERRRQRRRSRDKNKDRDNDRDEDVEEIVSEVFDMTSDHVVRTRATRRRGGGFWDNLFGDGDGDGGD